MRDVEHDREADHPLRTSSWSDTGTSRGGQPAAPEAKPLPREIRAASELLKVVGDLTRMRILCALLEGEFTVSDLQEILDMSQSAVSHQLRVLRDARLVTYRREWKMVYYSLADEHVRELLQFTLEHVRHD